MKLHVKAKRRRGIQRFLSVVLVLCMVLGNGGTQVDAMMRDALEESAQDGNGQIAGLEMVDISTGDDTSTTPGTDDTQGAEGSGEPENTGDPTNPVVTPEPVESPLPVDPEPSVEPTESTESTDPEETQKPQPSGEPTEPVEPTESEEPVEPTESQEPTTSAEPVESQEPEEPTESMEPAEPDETTEPDDGNAERNEAEWFLICGITEEEHTHTEECYRRIYCGQIAHAHTAECYDEDGNLICGIEEHTHGDSCFQAEEETTEKEDLILDGREWVLTCTATEEGHKHTEECYRRIYCGQIAHTHTAECYDGNGNVVCGIEEHIHTFLCYLTVEEQAAVEEVNRLIEALPTPEEVMERFEALGEDMDAYEAYYQELYVQVAQARAAYEALSEAQKQAVANGERLQEFDWLQTDTLEEVAPSELDFAYVSDFYIKAVQDGAGPFDNHYGHTDEECYEWIPKKDEKGRVIKDEEGNPVLEKGELICKQNIYEEGDGELICKPGDDRNEHNKIVRTFDALNYEFHVTLTSHDVTKIYKDAWVKLIVVLPVTKEEAEFDIGSMAWMEEDSKEGSTRKTTIEEVMIDHDGDGKETLCQVLTGYKHLTSGRSVIPGFFEDNVTINVKAMKDGDQISPVFYAVMEGGNEYDFADAPLPTKDENGNYVYNYTDIHECPTHPGTVEMRRADTPPIRVSAAPMFNVQLNGASGERRQYDFTEGAEWLDNQQTGYMTGRMTRIGVTLQLYNRNSSRGLKGIELPKEGEIIKLYLSTSSKYKSNDADSQWMDVTKDYTPLLWSCGLNRNADYGETNGDGRAIYDSYWGDGMAPYSNGGGKNGCYNSGVWEASQLKDGRIQVWVKEFSIDMSQMPGYDRGQDMEIETEKYGSYIGCFSSGVVWVLQPFNKRDAEGKAAEEPGKEYENADLDIVEEHGAGNFNITVEVDGLEITTIGEEEATDADGNPVKVQRKVTYHKSEVDEGNNEINAANIVTRDDRWAAGLELILPGNMINQVRYSDATGSQGVNIMSIRDGRDFATIGSEIWIMGGFAYYADRKEEHDFFYGTSLVKFYSKLIQLEETQPIEIEKEGRWVAPGERQKVSEVPGHSHLKTYLGNGAQPSGISVYYVAKADGSDWTSDEEMLDPKKEQGLLFFDHLDEGSEGTVGGGKECVGILYCFKGPGNAVEETSFDPLYQAFHKAKVREDASLIGVASDPQTYMMVSSSRVWTREMFAEQIGTDENIFDSLPIWSETVNDLDNTVNCDPAWKQYHMVSRKEDYEKTEYASNGSGVITDHLSDWSRWGDTLLMVGYKSSLEKNLLQKSGGTDKKVFNLDLRQRVADYVLKPSTAYLIPHSQGGTIQDNLNINEIKVVDTLPKYMRYRPDSAYIGGTYTQDGQNVGRQGTVTGGLKIEPNGEPVTCIDSAPDGESLPKTVSMTVETKGDQQIITWIFTNRHVGEKLPDIYYSVDIGSRTNANEDIPKGSHELLNKAYITADLDRRHPSEPNGNYAEESITVTRGNAGAYGKYALQDAVEEDGDIDYIIYYDNNSQNQQYDVLMMDTMPFNGVNGSHYTGKYTIESCKLDIGLYPQFSEKGLEVYYTTDTDYKDRTLSDKEHGVSRDEILGWTKATIKEDGTIELPKTGEGDNPPIVAWAIKGNINPGECIEVAMKIKLNPEANKENEDRDNYYVNLLSTPDTTIETPTPTVRRTLEGLTWMDHDRSALQDGNEQRDDQLAGVTVELWKLKKGGDATKWGDYVQVRYPVWEGDDAADQEGEGASNQGKPVSILTGQQISLRASGNGEAETYKGSGTVLGRYKFLDVPAGTYAVRFTGNGSVDMSRMTATMQDYELNKHEEIDSDGEAHVDGDGKLQETVILGIVMKEAETMFQEKMKLQESKYHDSGFFYDVDLNIQKIAEDGSSLSGATFVITNTEGQSLPFKANPEDQNRYTAVNDAAAVGARYYIVYAAERTHAVGFEVTTDGEWAKLQTKRDGDPMQLFEVRSNADGTFSFRCCCVTDESAWLTLKGNEIASGTGTEIILSRAETPTERMRWYLEQKGDGSYRIQAKAGRESQGGNQGFLDTNGNSTAENNQIWGYEGNGTPAQDWCLIPVTEDSDITYNLEVSNVEESKGQLIIGGLLPGEYYITEMKAPNGYLLLKTPVKIEVTKNGTIEVRSGSGSSQKDDDGIDWVRIRNMGAYYLPSTGGAGTIPYTAAGILMMASSWYAFRRRKRRSVWKQTDQAV